ncbi:MAG: DNA alkylation repair protein [Acidimicrobiia bacterium]|nr:DNA alkylation repair protein [Acidimicrobiia bacterium]
MVNIVEDCVSYVRSALADRADPDKAAAMQAYMKTDMPFYGVQQPGRTPILRAVLGEFRPATRDEYEVLVLGLWNLPHREERYIALGLAVRCTEFVVPYSLPLYKRLIVEGAWWDFVDEVATHLIRPLVVAHPAVTWPEVDTWIDDGDMWLRRSAILCQIGAKEHTDEGRLFAFCAARAHETEFFIRKAIGWALREHAKTNPEAVVRFVNTHREQLSGLSFREATKHIKELVAL